MATSVKSMDYREKRKFLTNDVGCMSLNEGKETIQKLDNTQAFAYKYKDKIN
jgi:hypothetical protein